MSFFVVILRAFTPEGSMQLCASYIDPSLVSPRSRGYAFAQDDRLEGRWRGNRDRLV